MGTQVSSQLQNTPSILSGISLVREQEIILQEATRTVPLKFFTLMQKTAANRKWTPLTSASITGTDGKAFSVGLYVGDDMAAADLAAADQTGPILVGGTCTVDASKLVFGKGPTDALTAQTLDTQIGGAAVASMTPTDLLENRGIFPAATFLADLFEN